MTIAGNAQAMQLRSISARPVKPQVSRRHTNDFRCAYPRIGSSRQEQCRRPKSKRAASHQVSTVASHWVMPSLWWSHAYGNGPSDRPSHQRTGTHSLLGRHGPRAQSATP